MFENKIIIGLTIVGEEGAISHRGKLSLSQNSIMQIRTFLDNAPEGIPKQQAFCEISHFTRKHVNPLMTEKLVFCQFDHE